MSFAGQLEQMQQNGFATGKERAPEVSALGRRMKYASECNQPLAILVERYFR